MIVVEHRPPLKRIETGMKPREYDPPEVDTDCIEQFIEQERVWKLLRQSAEGCNSVGGEEC